MEKWNVQYGNNTEIHPVSDELGEYVIAEVDPDSKYCPEKRERIARLVAAAPDLLAACEGMQRYNNAANEGRICDKEAGDYWAVVMDDIEAAITKTKV